MGGRLATGVAIAACVTFPVLELGAIAAGPERAALAPAVLATVCYLPPFLWIAAAVLSGRRPRSAWFALGGIAAVLAGAAVTVTAHTLPVFVALAVGAMLLVPPLWAPAVLVAVMVATAPLAIALGRPLTEFWYPFEVLWVYPVVALVAAVRRLEQARRELADEALLRERVRIDEELRRTIGAAVGDLADRGERIVAAVGAEEAPAELAEVVAAARRSQAQVRQVLRTYQRPTVAAELEAAAALLAAGGIRARAEPLPEEPPGQVAAALRQEVRAATTRLLLGPPPGPVVLRVCTTGDDPRLVVEPDHDDGAAPDGARTWLRRAARAVPPT